MRLEDLNALDAEAAGRELLKCCGSPRWARRMTAMRPFASVEAMMADAAACWAALDPADWLEAFAAHPRIGAGGAKASAAGDDWAAQEQAGVAAAADATLRRLADRNRDYDARFGYIFIVCATGKSAVEMLDMLERRLGNDPETEITVVNGSTEGMIAAMLGLLDPGDEILVFEPFYENYGPDAILTGAVPRYVTLHEPDWSIDPDELRAAVTPRTRGIVVNSPHNPTGKVLTRAELTMIAELCLEHDLIAFTDDIYQHLVYEGEHVPLAMLPGMRDRTVAIDSMSKTYSVTGWRVGWVIAAPDLSIGVRRAHDFLTVGAAAPLQEAATVAMAMPDSYYEALVAGYRERRDTLLPALAEAGFRLHEPDGAYYVMTDIAGLTSDDDVTFARRLIHDPGVAAVPGSSFFSRPELGRTKLRFAFPKRLETLRAASERLAKLAGTATPA